MSDYAFTHNGQHVTPNQTAVQDADAHNAAIEAAELATWATKPERMTVYYHFPNHEQGGQWRGTFYPHLTGAHITTWRGVRIGHILTAKVYRHNFGGRMVSLTVRGTNGATYHGRASWDNGTCINLRRSK